MNTQFVVSNNIIYQDGDYRYVSNIESKYKDKRKILFDLAFLSCKYPVKNRNIQEIVFDIETEGNIMKRYKHLDISLIDASDIRILSIGLARKNESSENEKIWQTIISLEDYRDEKQLLIDFFNIIHGKNNEFPVGNDPILLTGYNSAQFDLPIIIQRCEYYNLDYVKHDYSKRYTLKYNNYEKSMFIPLFKNCNIFHLDLYPFISSNYMFKNLIDLSLKNVSAYLRDIEPRKDKGIDAAYWFKYDKDKFNEYLNQDIEETIIVSNCIIPVRKVLLDILNLPMCCIYYTDVQSIEFNLVYKTIKNHIKEYKKNNYILSEDELLDYLNRVIIFPSSGIVEDTSDEEAAEFLGLSSELCPLDDLMNKSQIEKLYNTIKTSYTGGLSGCKKAGTYYDVFHIDFRSQYPTNMIIMAHKDPIRFGGLFTDEVSNLMNQRFKYKKIIEYLETLSLSNLDLNRRLYIENELSLISDKIYTQNDIFYLKSAEQAIKIIINSMYGLRGRSKGEFIDIKFTSMVTAIGRVLLRHTMYYLKQYFPSIKVVQLDTDGLYITGVSYKKLKHVIKYGFNTEIQKRLHSYVLLELDKPIIAITIPVGEKAKNYVYTDIDRNGNKVVHLCGLLTNKSILCNAQKKAIKDYFLNIHINRISNELDYYNWLAYIKKKFRSYIETIDDISFTKTFKKYPRESLFHSILSEDNFETTTIRYIVTGCDSNGKKTQVKISEDCNLSDISISYYYFQVYNKIKDYIGLKNHSRVKKTVSQKTLFEYQIINR